MKYEYKQKFDIVGADFSVEILGCYTAGQQRIVQMKDNSYKICLNGIEVDISEQNLALLEKAGQVQPSKEDEVKPLVGGTMPDDEPKKTGKKVK